MPTNALCAAARQFSSIPRPATPPVLRRFREAKTADAPEVVVWGSGTPRREFRIRRRPRGRLRPSAAALFRASPTIDIGVGYERDDCGIRRTGETLRAVPRTNCLMTRRDPTECRASCSTASRIHALGWSAMTPLERGAPALLRVVSRKPGALAPTTVIESRLRLKAFETMPCSIVEWVSNQLNPANRRNSD